LSSRWADQSHSDRAGDRASPIAITQAIDLKRATTTTVTAPMQLTVSAKLVLQLESSVSFQRDAGEFLGRIDAALLRSVLGAVD
jgi:hypothetical protein